MVIRFEAQSRQIWFLSMVVFVSTKGGSSFNGYIEVLCSILRISVLETLLFDIDIFIDICDLSLTEHTPNLLILPIVSLLLNI